jgi:nucleotide-binding universal stress UspA family protein
MTEQPLSDESVEPLPPSEEPTVDAAYQKSGASGDKLSVKRILVALDASANSREALTVAAGLARTLHSEIAGLFIEDINLVRLSELPFAREVIFAESSLRNIEREGLQRRLRTRAAVLRRELTELANEYQITSTFQVLQGSVSREILSASLEADMLAVGRLGQSIIRRTKLGSTAREVVARATSTVLLVKSGVESGPIIALFDGSAAGVRALRLAADLIDPVGDLRVLAWALDEQAAFERRQLAVEILKDDQSQVQFQHLSGDNPQQVIEWVNRQKGSLLILSDGEGNLPIDILQLLLEDAEQHILIVR